MKVALMFSQPCHICFPLFQEMLTENKDLFTAIYCSFTNENQPDNYKNFIEKSLPFVTFINLPKKDEEKKPDWRDEAVSNIIEVAQHNNQITHFLFIEQDFLINGRFWNKVLADDKPFVYYEEGGRIHPAFALVQKNLVMGTDKDFSANPPAYDHFGKFFLQVRGKERGVELQELGLKQGEDFYHLAGCTQNYSCFANNQPFYKPDEFLAYNYHSFYLKGQNNTWRKLEAQVLDKHGRGDAPFLDHFFK